MLAADDLAILRDAASRAAAATLWRPERDLRAALFPFWSDAIHLLLLRRGCPCAAGSRSGCFQQLSPGEQAERFRTSSIGLEAFISVIVEARRLLRASG